MNAQLEQKMVSGFNACYETSKNYNAKMRSGAFALSIKRVADAIKLLGIWP